MLAGKHILLGITGSIAAYKAAALTRLLVKAGCEVQVVMTTLAKQFITPLTMATLSKRPILVEFFDPENGAWNSHIKLGEWADCMLVAPATANTLAKMAHGVADNLLLTSYLSARCPVAVAPAMDLDMFAHPSTQENLRLLASRGVKIVDPGSGFLASGLEGKGRMAEPEQIVAFLEELFDEKKKSLAGKHLLVTAGPTCEAIDPVRYITNHSTGKMGYAIAGELAARGARVTLVSGPTQLACPKGVDRVDVRSAEQMYEASTKAFPQADGAVMCAAVADYTPAVVADRKIKKSDDDMAIPLKRTRDIAAELGRQKEGRLLVGFALETDHELEHAQGKLERKNLDFIVLNSLQNAGAGFGVDTNVVTLIDRQGREELPLLSKHEVASRIVDKIESLILK
ncbi:MAG: bifunctional phosphopantothenoylcysteine decarboxylase/phosphopantothenate--cysteine ligase CoaBC [Rikenellaceae bacterium]|nr:bifunctional phosphopantothenoylcysteine decarboxylase/phosphopantothenate--cysteine ligase CoaBC [Rikenellaceae bacterium]